MVKAFIASDNPKLLKSFSVYRNNLQWLTKNRERLRTTKYGNTYVAIHKKQVCLHKKDLLTLLHEIKRKYDTPQEVVVDYIGRKKISLLL